MIETVSAIQFDKVAGSGRTNPGFITCERSDGEAVEVVAKLSFKCDLQETSLAMELICACLAGDLGLPVPQPHLVRLDPEWISTIVDAAWAASARQSCPVAFGSKRVQPGFSSWVVGTPLLGDSLQTAAAVLLFDAIAINPDRREANPNCLQRGSELRIIDHELCFSPLPLLGWKPPWELGALKNFETPGAHIFRAALRKKVIDWNPVRAAWSALSDAQMADYEAVLPAEWSAAIPAVGKAIEKIRSARDNIDECINEVGRVLQC